MLNSSEKARIKRRVRDTLYMEAPTSKKVERLTNLIARLMDSGIPALEEVLCGEEEADEQ
jgi:hypothetical protein